MSSQSRVRVYMACSLDGFIAGANNDLSWLNKDRTAPGDIVGDAQALGFEQFMSDVGAMLMGRTTFDVVESFGKSQWAYGDTPVIVATKRPLEPSRDSVQAIAGSIEQLVEKAKGIAGHKDVYLDGGTLISQALNAKLVDEITVSFVPVLLGNGTRLSDGLLSSVDLQFRSHHAMEGGMVQLTAIPRYPS